MNRLFFVFLAVAMAFAVPSGVFAEDEEEMGYSYADVISVDVTRNELVVSEYNWETDTDTSVTYSVSKDVKLENASSLSEIKKGDEVSIDYTTDKNKKVAKYIMVYKQDSSAVEYISNIPVNDPMNDPTNEPSNDFNLDY